MKKAWNDIKDSYNTNKAVAKNMKQFENEQKVFKKEFVNKCWDDNKKGGYNYFLNISLKL